MKIILENEYNEFIDSINKKAITSVRTNNKKSFLGFNENEKIPWTENGFYLQERPNFTLDFNFHLGKYYVQEPSSMILQSICKQLFPNPLNLKIADLCAAPGGKTTLLSDYFYGNNNYIIANEIDPKRNSILQENVMKWGLDNVLVCKNKLEDFQHLNNYFDLIVLDAPCSGEGMFRKDNFAIEQWNMNLIKQCSYIQQNALKSAISALKCGGYLIYSTCTYNAIENEEKLNYCIENFDVENIQIQLDAKWGFITKNSTEKYITKAFPHNVQGEGFSFFVVKKISNRGTNDKYNFKLNGSIITNKLIPTEKFSFSDERLIIEYKDNIYSCPKNWFDEIKKLNTILYFTYFPTRIGKLKANKIIPHQAYLLSIHSNPNFECIEIENENILKYFATQTFAINNQNKAVQIFQFNNNNIGFINNIGNRFNNLYPIEWRIKKI